MSLQGPVFLSTRKSDTRMNVRSLRRRIDEYLDKAGLKRSGVSAHSLRTTSSTLLLEAGASLLEIQKHLGHSSPETTIKYLARIEQLGERAGDKVPLKMV